MFSCANKAVFAGRRGYATSGRPDALWASFRRTRSQHAVCGDELSICLVVACGRIPVLPTRVISVLGLKGTLERPQTQVYSAGNGLLAGENGWPFRRFCGGGGGLPAPLLAPRALILRTKQRLDRAFRPTPPYFGHA